MKNVYDIKREKNLNFILPLNKLLNVDDEFENKILVVAHLYYEESLELYTAYIDKIPSHIDVVFTSSKPEVLSLLKDYTKTLSNNYKIIKKSNRGRDISGLLVACSEEILEYQYVCFVHDKKAKSEKTVQDTEIFVECLWDNMLGSREYILNIISTFNENPSLGLLLPPESISNNFSFFFRNTWDKNFELAESLAEKMDLNCNFDSRKKPLSLGTVFWAKVPALHKLFDMEWRYENFDEEPLAADGTISHAIERIFSYVAQDAGYETGIVMTDQFAGKRMDRLQDIMTIAFRCLEQITDIRTVGSLNRCDKLIEFVSKYEKVYIYGAGIVGKQCAKILNALHCTIEAFLVSSMEGNAVNIGGVPVLQFSDKYLRKNAGIIVAVGEKNRKEILEAIGYEKENNLNIQVFC